jgi:vacuolar-type H+-ATPase subunit H
MTEANEHVSDQWFALYQLRGGNEVGDVDRTLDNGDQPREPETEGSAPEETDVDLRAELASVNERHEPAEAELARVRPASDEGEDAVTTASYAAARVLEIATRNADALVEEARDEAHHMVTQARAQAEKIIQGRLADARAREEAMSVQAEEQRGELDRARREARHELEERRAELDATVNQLVEFESQFRKDLISYFNGQLETLHRPTVAEALAIGDAEQAHAS